MSVDARISTLDLMHLPKLSAFWYDMMMLQQQQSEYVRLSSNARAEWEAAITVSLDDPDVYCRVAMIETNAVGLIQTCIRTGPPGLVPRRFGYLSQFVLDIHSARSLAGVGRLLVEAAQQWLRKQDIHHIRVETSPKSVVARAFWQSQGAHKVDDVLWMNL